jgi:hypothetical protein
MTPLSSPAETAAGWQEAAPPPETLLQQRQERSEAGCSGGVEEDFDDQNL